MKYTEKHLIAIGWTPFEWFPQADITLFIRNCSNLLQYGELKKGKFKSITEKKVKKYQGGNW